MDKKLNQDIGHHYLHNAAGKPKAWKFIQNHGDLTQQMQKQTTTRPSRT